MTKDNFLNTLLFLDNIIKIWRLFPFAEEALAPLMTLYFDELPRHLCVSHHRLLVALYERSRANYAVTVYKTTQKGTCIQQGYMQHVQVVRSFVYLMIVCQLPP